MSIIVYDGETLAIDNAAIHEGTKVPIVKSWINPHTGAVLTGIGNAAQIELMIDWHAAGAKVADFPETQRAANPWCELIVVSKEGLKRYETTPFPVNHQHNKCAFGVGKDFAYGAMAMGATAAQAAEVTLRYATDTGHGIATYDWKGK